MFSNVHVVVNYKKVVVSHSMYVSVCSSSCQTANRKLDRHDHDSRTQPAIIGVARLHWRSRLDVLTRRCWGCGYRRWRGKRTPPAGGLAHERGTGMARPLVLPETFDGTGSWSDWCFHFENVATMNGWDSAQKLQWLRVRVTGRAQKALHHLPGPVATSY